MKNQGQCPASYAFSAVAALEGLSAIYYRNPQELSVQQIIDCSSSVGNQGCQTGTMTATFSYVMNKGTYTNNSRNYNTVNLPIQRLCPTLPD